MRLLKAVLERVDSLGLLPCGLCQALIFGLQVVVFDFQFLDFGLPLGCLALEVFVL